MSKQPQADLLARSLEQPLSSLRSGLRNHFSVTQAHNENVLNMFLSCDQIEIGIQNVLRTHRNQLNEVTRVVSDKEKKDVELKKLRRRFKEAEELHVGQLGSLRGELQDAKAKIDTLEKRVSKLKESKEVHRHEVLATENEDLRKSNYSFEMTIRQLRSEQRDTVSSQKYNRLQIEHNQLLNRFSDLQRQLVATQADNKSLGNQKRNLETRIGVLNGKITERDATIQSLNRNKCVCGGLRTPSPSREKEQVDVQEEEQEQVLEVKNGDEEEAHAGARYLDAVDDDIQRVSCRSNQTCQSMTFLDSYRQEDSCYSSPSRLQDPSNYCLRKDSLGSRCEWKTMDWMEEVEEVPEGETDTAGVNGLEPDESSTPSQESIESQQPTPEATSPSARPWRRWSKITLSLLTLIIAILISGLSIVF